jgi:hypothetical protein
MIVTPIGSCRIDEIAHSSLLNRKLSYTHCTKEVIQLIRHLKGEETLEYPFNKYCLSRAIENDAPIELSPEYKYIFDNTNAFVIEISSMKKYEYKGKYLSHLVVDKRMVNRDYLKTPVDIMNETKIVVQKNEEIENDILEIRRLVHPRPLLIVSHYNVTHNNDKIPQRDYLIKLLGKICKKHKIMFLNPTNLVAQFAQSDIMEPDLGHINPITKHVVHNHINLCVSYLIQKGELYKPDTVFLQTNI